MLKCELHTHCNLDPVDTWIKYSPQELIDKASQKNYDVLALTCHDKIIHTKELEDYAKEKKILLIPSIERTIEKNHVLIYNVTNKETSKIDSYQNLRKFKDDKLKRGEEFLIVAAHPFYPGSSCARKNAIRNKDLFDAFEHSWFYTRFWNPNKKTLKIAKKYSKPVIGNSDVHDLRYLGLTYSLIDSKKNVASIFEAIRNKKVKIKSRPLRHYDFFKNFISIFMSKFKG